MKGGSLGFLATDEVPDAIFGVPVVKDGYTEEDLAFFRDHPEAGGYYDDSDEPDDPGVHAAEGGGDYGLRNDGKTYKGTGWLGELPLKGGGVATEYSIGVNIGGKEMDIPSLVPTLTKDEVSLMTQDLIPNGKPLPEAIVRKAAEHAKKMMAEGKSVWANDGKAPDKGKEKR